MFLDDEIPKLMSEFPFGKFLKDYLSTGNMSYGSYFDYTEYMWSLKDEPHILLVYFEDLIQVRHQYYTLYEPT